VYCEEIYYYFISNKIPAIKADISLNTADISLNLSKINELSNNKILAQKADISLEIQQTSHKIFPK